ncbi:unnamed protein product [Danaus chrysippus]|uniref:(African queen) hypothetical protein n=1 Tax=Danaus chrysippus TaxID=151541 RepID=A0A8J2R7I5_9NEOP|nr:unnamed protein product [Danaus chrysippus]
MIELKYLKSILRSRATSTEVCSLRASTSAVQKQAFTLEVEGSFIASFVTEFAYQSPSLRRRLSLLSRPTISTHPFRSQLVPVTRTTVFEPTPCADYLLHSPCGPLATRLSWCCPDGSSRLCKLNIPMGRYPDNNLLLQPDINRCSYHPWTFKRLVPTAIYQTRRNPKRTLRSLNQ